MGHFCHQDDLALQSEVTSQRALTVRGQAFSAVALKASGVS